MVLNTSQTVQLSRICPFFVHLQANFPNPCTICFSAFYQQTVENADKLPILNCAFSFNLKRDEAPRPI